MSMNGGGWLRQTGLPNTTEYGVWYGVVLLLLLLGGYRGNTESTRHC